MNRQLKKLIFVMLLFLSNTIYSQTKSLEIFGGVSGYNFGDKSLRRSMKSFTDYWGKHGEPDINVKGYKIGYDLKYGIHVVFKPKNSSGTKLLGLEHYKFQCHSYGQYIYGQRHFTIITKGGNLIVGQRTSNGLGLKLGVGFFNSVLESYFKYPSGVISYGKDKGMNGVYGTTYGGNVKLEVSKQFIFFKHIGFEASIFYNTSGFSTEYYDPSYAKGINTAVNYSWIPEDFDGYYQAVNSGGVYEGKNVKSNSNSIGISLTASYFFTFRKTSHHK